MPLPEVLSPPPDSVGAADGAGALPVGAGGWRTSLSPVLLGGGGVDLLLETGVESLPELQAGRASSSAMARGLMWRRTMRLWSQAERCLPEESARRPL